MSQSQPTGGPRPDRRTAIKWMLTAATFAAWRTRSSLGAELGKSPSGGAVGYGGDPDLIREYNPGELWPLTFTAEQRRTAGALCDLILPADENSPSASAVHVIDFIDEWISAPYPEHLADRPVVLDGLAWLDREAEKRFAADFGHLALPQQTAIAEDVCSLAHAQPEFKAAAQFFKKFRALTADGYYSSPEGMKAIGYLGNMPSETFAGPPPEVLRHLGLA